jgi:hypothetical protein
MSAAMLCNMIFMHVLYCGLFGDVASISRTCLMYSRVLPLIRNRVLQVGIRAWLVLSRPKPAEFPVVCDMYGSTVGTCCVVLFFQVGLSVVGE